MTLSMSVFYIPGASRSSQKHRKPKKFLGCNVLTAAQERISFVFDRFPRIYLAFSGGKDSTVLFHLCAAEARKRGRKFGLLFIDWECQYRLTIEHVTEMVRLYADCIELYWCCIPMRTVNSVSMYEPEWIAWENGKEWIREKPDCAVRDGSFFPFYVENMTFEEFVPLFGKWYAGSEKTACFIGIRASESLTRWTTVASDSRKRTYEGKRWTTQADTVCNVYPIYDWKTEDIWTYCGKYGKIYNRLYDRFYQAGIPLSRMRICEPFGNEQRQALDFYHVIEPETWGRMVARVNGANFGSIYARERGMVLGNYRISKPEQLTWAEFARLLLDSMPQATAEHYKNKIAVYIHWWLTKGGITGAFPDEQENDLAGRDVPSWRRICKCILKNDYWCKMLCFAPTKTNAYQAYCALMKRRREKWNLI